MKRYLTYYIDHVNEAVPKVEYVLDVFFDLLGIRIKKASVLSSDVDLVYSMTKPPEDINAFWIKAIDQSLWNSLCEINVIWENDFPKLLSSNQKLWDLHTEDYIGFDIIYASFLILSGRFEEKQERDEWGVPIFKNSFYEKSSLINFPSISIYARFLLEKIEKFKDFKTESISIWPNNKKTCLIITHDVDEPFISPPLTKYFIKKTVREFSNYNIKALVKILIKESLSGFKNNINTDPNFCFEKWMQYEKSINSKSAFYVAVENSANKFSSKNDVVYDYKNKHIVRALNNAINNGWEVGLHASINAKTSLERFVDEKRKLEKVLHGYEVKGVRHHFWAIDRVSSDTFSMHKTAGFHYDSSLGMNDAYGFRRGMIHPHFLFDKRKNSKIDLLQIPPTLMDGGIFYENTDLNDGVNKIKKHINDVRNYNGLMVLNWHLEQLNFDRLNGAGKAFTIALNELPDAQDIYFATPIELTEYWLNRRKNLAIF